MPNVTSGLLQRQTVQTPLAGTLGALVHALAPTCPSGHPITTVVLSDDRPRTGYADDKRKGTIGRYHEATLATLRVQCADPDCPDLDWETSPNVIAGEDA